MISLINTERIKNEFDLSRRLQMLVPCATVQLGVVHEGIETTIAVVLGEIPPLPAETASAIEWPASLGGAIDLGLILAASDASRVSDRADKNGVLVIAVRPDGRGADLGIAPGDVILAVGGRMVQTPDEIRQALQDAYGAGHSATLMRIKSGDATRFVAVPFDPV